MKVKFQEDKKNYTEPPLGGRTQFLRALLSLPGRFSVRINLVPRAFVTLVQRNGKTTSWTRVKKALEKKLHTHNDYKKTNMPSIQQSFYLLNACTICAIFLHKWTQCTDIFTKVCWKRYRCTEPWNSQIFLCNRNNPVKRSACVVCPKIAIECAIAFPETRLSIELLEIWHEK